MAFFFWHVPEAPPDPILGTSLAFNADPDPRKINLGVGAYRDEKGKPFVLDVVRQAEEELMQDLATGKANKEYSTIDGPADLKILSQKMLFGAECQAIKDGRIAAIQALSGTGALRVAVEFLRTHVQLGGNEAWVSNPTWGNHNTIFKKAGLTVKQYPYWDEATKSLNFEGMINALKTQAQPGALVLLHACAHNPTGVDPTEDQWRQIAEVMKERKLLTFMDIAYQGYATGSLEKDAFACRHFINQGMEMIVCQSFAKNLGLYGERVGLLHFVCDTPGQAANVLSQLKMEIRPMYSSPPKHGAELVVKILGNEQRYRAWQEELKGMANRIQEVRALLRKGLEDKGTPGTWAHITDQIGMFSFTGLTVAQCERLIKEHHIYLLTSGRISLAGLNKSNIQYMIDSVDEVVRACPAPPPSAL